jgi:hypothetical protein
MRPVPSAIQWQRLQSGELGALAAEDGRQGKANPQTAGASLGKPAKPGSGCKVSATLKRFKQTCGHKAKGNLDRYEA